MATMSTTYDVFISHSASDNDIAAEVAEGSERGHPMFAVRVGAEDVAGRIDRRRR